MVKGTIDYDGLIQELEKISNHPDVDLNTKKICKSQFLLYSGYKNNNEYIVACHKMLEALQKRAFIPVIEALKMEVHKFYLNYLNWHKKLVSFSKVLESNGDWTHFFSLTVNESKVKYEFETFSQIIDGKFGIQESSSLSKKAFQELISRLKTCESHFSNTGNINNYATALLEHYGISCLLKFKSEAEEAYRSIMVLKETLQDKELINRIEFQLNGGLPHLVWFKNFGHEQ